MILSIDYGKKNVGLATADPNLKIALPEKDLKSKSKKFLFKQLKEIVKKKKIKKIVVGRPIGMSGRLTQQTKIIDKFIQELKKEIKLPIIRFDERLTSKMAMKLCLDKQKSHSLAAMIILQDYLNCLPDKKGAV